MARLVESVTMADVAEAFAVVARRAAVGAPTCGVAQRWALEAVELCGGWETLKRGLRRHRVEADVYREAFFRFCEDQPASKAGEAWVALESDAKRRAREHSLTEAWACDAVEGCCGWRVLSEMIRSGEDGPWRDTFVREYVGAFLRSEGGKALESGWIREKAEDCVLYAAERYIGA